MAGTLGQQIEIRKLETQPVRQTRTERQVFEQKKVNYERLKAEAERLKNEVFVDKIETVTERYRSGGRWRTRTVQKVTDPFTDEEYAQEYAKLSPELKQFFASPSDLNAQKQQKINESKAQATTVIEGWRTEMENRKARLEEFKRRWKEKSREYREKNRERYNQTIDDYEADIKEYERKINILNSEFGKIDEGYNWQDIKSYAEDYAQSRREKSEYYAGLRDQYSKNPSLVPIYSTENQSDATRKIVGLIDTTKNPLPEYLKNQKNLTQSDISYYNSIANWSKTKGYNALPDWAKQKVLNPKAYEWQQKNPTENLIFDNQGNVQYVQTQKYVSGGEKTQLLSPAQYESKIKETQTLKLEEFKKANPNEKVIMKDDGSIDYIESEEFGGKFSIEDYNKKVEEYNKNAPQRQLEAWKIENAKKPIYLDIDDKLNPIKPDEDIVKEDGKVMATIKKGIDWVMNKTGDIKLPLFSIGTFGGQNYLGGEVNIRDVTTPAKEGIAKAQENLFIDEITKSGLKQELDTKYQNEYQTRFERAYMEKIILGQTDFETASGEFGKSNEAKVINKKYELELQARSGGKFTVQGLKILGLGVAQTGLKLVPETYGELAVTAALAYTGYKALTYIPASVLNITTAGFGIKGTLDALSPTKSSTEKWGGVLTATVSFGTLGYQAYKWARTPTVKTENLIFKKQIRNPKLERGFLTKSGTLKETDVYGNTQVKEMYKAQKLSEQTLYGRRTIVSTKWRDLVGMKPIYQGVPYQQVGKTYYMSSLRGIYIFKEQSAYQKAMDLLVKRGGLTKVQATQTLRYYQPKDIMSNYQANILVRSGSGYKNPIIDIKGIRDVEQPIITINKELGIKTRGATAIKEYIKGRGQIVGEIKGNTVYDTTFQIEKRFLTKSGLEYQRLLQAGKTTTTFRQLTISTEKGQDILKLPTSTKSVKTLNPYDVYGEQNLFKQIIPKGKRGFSETESGVFTKQGKTIGIDYRDVYGIRVQEQLNKVTPKSDVTKLNDPEYMKQVIKSLRDIYGKGSVDKTIFAKAGKTVGRIGGVQSRMAVQETTKLKSTLSPVQSAKMQIKNILNVFTKTTSASALGVAGAVVTSTVTKPRLREDVKYKLNDKLSDAQYTKLLDKLGETQKPRQTPREKLGTSQQQVVDLINPPENTLKTPINPPNTIVRPAPKPKPFVMPSSDFLKKKIQERASGSRNIVGLLPDFTSRALGLKPKSVNIKDVLKEMKKVQTGFEIRTGATIKGINEKDLMRGIVK